MKAKAVAEFDAGRQEFEDNVCVHLKAAFVVNAKGECPAAVSQVLRLFTGEMETLAGWLQKAGESSQATMILADLKRARQFINENSDESKPAKRNKSKPR